MGEFDLIERFFAQRFHPLSREHNHVSLGIGDDCALLTPPPGQLLATSTDTMVQGRHFLAGADAAGLGHKALATNLSDLAACGAKPLGFLLSLTLPAPSAAWLDAFSQGLLELAVLHGCPLVGGNTTAGPLAIAITVFGAVPPGQALLRSGAAVGDDLYVSGSPGEAYAGLQLATDAWDAAAWQQLSPQAAATAAQRMHRPTPRVALGLALRGLATSCLDVSDGLLGDMAHILKASDVAAEVDLALLEQLPSALKRPLSALIEGDSAIKNAAACAGFTAFFGKYSSENLSPTAQALGLAPWQACALAGGDDYELVFTAPPARRAAVAQAAAQSATPVTRIGSITPQSATAPSGATGLWIRRGQLAHPAREVLPGAGFDHFVSPQ